jgi:hypothetical protein
MIKSVDVGALPAANFEGIAAILGFFHTFLEFFTKFIIFRFLGGFFVHF